MDQLSLIAASPASRALNQLLHCLLLPPPASAPNPAKPIIDTASASKKNTHLSPSSLDLSRHGDGQGDGAPRAASGPPRRRAGRTAAHGRDLHPAGLLSLFPSVSPSPSPSRHGQANDGWHRRARRLRAPSSSSFPLATGPRRCPPASLAPSAASSLCSVCVHVLQVLQETLAACARGRGGPASSQPPAAVPFSSVDALPATAAATCRLLSLRRLRGRRGNLPSPPCLLAFFY